MNRLFAVLAPAGYARTGNLRPSLVGYLRAEHWRNIDCQDVADSLEHKASSELTGA